jgi:hypothetical protein
MRTTVERLPDGSDWVALLRGPIVLVSPAGTNDLAGLRADDSRMGHVAHGPTVPLDRVPVLLAGAEALPQHVKPDTAAGPLHFRLEDIVAPPVSGGLPLLPFFRLHDARYQMYWHLSTQEEFLVRRERIAAEERAKAAREASTLDWVAIGEQQPEVEHGYAGEENATGLREGRRWRRGRWFQYTLNTRGERAVELAVTCWGGDRHPSYDILADGTPLESEDLERPQPGKFFERRYPIPAEVIASAKSGRLTIKFSAKPGSGVAGVFDVRLMKQGAP